MIDLSRWICWRWALVCGVAACAGCGTQPGKPTGGVAPGKSVGQTDVPPQSEPTPVEIQLNWFPEAEHGGYYAALVHGYYAEAGLAMTITPGGPNVPLMESVATGRVAFGVDNADKLLRARAQEADVVALFAPIQDSPRCIMVHEESGIAKLADLQTVEGVTLAWNSAQPFALFLMKKYDLSKLTMTKYPGSVGPFLVDQKFAQQAYNISEPFLAQEKDAQAKPVCLMLSDVGFNTYTSLLLTSSDTVKAKPALIRQVVQASLRGWQKYLTDPEDTNRQIGKLNPEMSAGVLALGAEALRTLCRPGDMPESELGRMTAERWTTLTGQLEEIEAIKPDSVQADAAFTMEFLPAGK